MPTSSRPRFAAAALAPALGLLLLLAGCSGPTPDGAAGNDTSAPTDDAAFSAARDAYDLKLAQCLRDAGFDVKDPKPGEGITETAEGINEAASVCMGEIGDPPTSGGKVDETEMLETMLGWAECLRERGITVEEPQLGQAFFVPEDASPEELATCMPPE